MPRSFVTGVGDPITIPLAEPTGQVLWTTSIPSGLVWTLEQLLLNWGIDDVDAGKVVFHVFVKDANGVTLSPFWQYAWLKSQHPDWWQAQSFPLHLPVYGPATITVLVVNDSGRPQQLYWSALWSVDP